jgi:spectrin beta
LLQKFLTDLSASSKRIKALDTAVEEFVQQGHSQLDKVQARQKHIHQVWDHLNWLKGQKERSLEGASRYLSHSVMDSYMKVLHTCL